MAELYQIPNSKVSEEFAHESERRIADLFDFYGVSWEYEPKTFILEEDEEGTLFLHLRQIFICQTMTSI